MSFGYSVGDFIAAGALIRHIIGSLRNAGGSKAEYQEVIRELESLQRLLQHVDHLQPHGCSPLYLAGAKHAALSCQLPLKEFQKRISKYEQKLGILSIRAGAIGVARKIEWELKMKESVKTLRAVVTQWIVNINALLAIHGLELLQQRSQEAQEERMVIQSLVRQVDQKVDDQNSLVVGTTSAVNSLVAVVRGDVVKPLTNLAGLVTTVCLNIQQLTSHVLAIHTVVTRLDTGFSYFQPPLKVEDAFGQTFPFPSELTYRELDAVLKSRFREKAVSQQVDAGEYEVSNAKNSGQIINVGAFDALPPGMSVVMAVILTSSPVDGDECPNQGCTSRQSVAADGGGRRCLSCQAWFDTSTWSAVKELRPGRPVNEKDAENTAPRVDTIPGCDTFGKEDQPTTTGVKWQIRNIRVRSIIIEEVSPSNEWLESLWASEHNNGSNKSPKAVRFALRSELVTGESRPPNQTEAWSLWHFEAHTRACPTCHNPYEVQRRRGRLCSDGHSLAQDVAIHVYYSDGEVYSTAREQHKLVRVEIPPDYAQTRGLLMSMESGIRSSGVAPVVSKDEYVDELMPLKTPILKVSRPMTACLRCRKAKIKCDGKLPACSSCEKNGRAAECEFDRGMALSTLETRIGRYRTIPLEEAS